MGVEVESPSSCSSVFFFSSCRADVLRPAQTSREAEFRPGQEGAPRLYGCGLGWVVTKVWVWIYLITDSCTQHEVNSPASQQGTGIHPSNL